MKNAVSVITTLVMMAAATMAHAAGDAKAGQAKAAACAACHGVDGNSNGPDWPNLAGQHESYLVKQLQAFKTGVRNNPLMMPQASTLSDQDMADISAYFAAQKVKGGEADAAKVQTGKQIYQAGVADTKATACLACHGPDGRGNPAAGYPSLHGQRSAYVATQLQNYKSGTRTTDKAQGGVMQTEAHKLTDDQIKAVAAYIQGLR